MNMKGWKAEQGCSNSIVIVDLDGGPDVCEIVAEGDENTPEEWERAYIIAAAPVLLDACKKTMSEVGMTLTKARSIAYRAILRSGVTP